MVFSAEDIAASRYSQVQQFSITLDEVAVGLSSRRREWYSSIKSSPCTMRDNLKLKSCRRDNVSRDDRRALRAPRSRDATSTRRCTFHDTVGNLQVEQLVGERLTAVTKQTVSDAALSPATSSISFFAATGKRCRQTDKTVRASRNLKWAAWVSREWVSILRLDTTVCRTACTANAGEWVSARGYALSIGPVT